MNHYFPSLQVGDKFINSSHPKKIKVSQYQGIHALLCMYMGIIFIVSLNR